MANDENIGKKLYQIRNQSLSYFHNAKEIYRYADSPKFIFLFKLFRI